MIEGDASLHFLQRLRFTPGAAHLGKARNAGLDFVTQHVAIDEISILLIVRAVAWGRGPTSDMLPESTFNSWGKLIERSLPEHFADRRDARIAPRRLANFQSLLRKLACCGSFHT